MTYILSTVGCQTASNNEQNHFIKADINILHNCNEKPTACFVSQGGLNLFLHAQYLIPQNLFQMT